MGFGQSALNKGDGFPSCAKWISDTSLRFGKWESPTPLVFQKELRLSVLPRRAEILCTAMGIYTLELDGKPIGEDYFAPGLTSYAHQLQYQRYDITPLLKETSVLTGNRRRGLGCGRLYRQPEKQNCGRPSLSAAGAPAGICGRQHAASWHG